MLHLVYRSYGGENWKRRPAFYGKQVALLSFLRAAERVDADVLFINDGPVSEDLLALMRPAGRIVTLPGVGMRASYTAALQLPVRYGWDDRDLVWFSEDDYLYHPEAFADLERVARQIPQADYFALYSMPWEAVPPGGDGPHVPRGYTRRPTVEIEGRTWGRQLSTASTFGARAGALREDYWIFRLCMAGHRTMYRDHDTCVVIQGYEPHPWGRLLRGAVGLNGGPLRSRVRDLWLTPFLVATNLRSHRRAARRRLYVAPRPALATHLETGVLAPGCDWEALARDTWAWAAESGRSAEVLR